MRTFVPLTENNDWESETWIKWLQVEGNEDELEYLYTVLHKLEATEQYELDLNDRESEEVVDRIVARATVGYDYSDQKIVGKLTLPDIQDQEDLDGALYKGHIEKLFKE